jgi:hypothetical protein
VLDTAIVNSAFTAKVNVMAYKYYKVSKNYFCRLRGNLKFNKEIFLDSKINKISTKKMKTTDEAIEFNLYSPDPNCPFNIQASLKYKINYEGFSTLLFCLYVMLLSGFIIRGGYKIITKFTNDITIANRYSLVTLQIAVTLDFGFMINFLVSGNWFIPS